MKYTHTLRSLSVAAIAALAFGLSSCDKDDELEVKPTANAPETYNFQNVNYGGQTVRLLLLKDLETEMEKAKTQAVDKSTLLTIFNNSDNRYADIAAGKKLSDKMNNAATRAQVEMWFHQIDSMSRSATPDYVTAEGVDLKQMVAKTIMGSVFYYRAMTDYINIAKLNAADNATVTPGDGTAMEHYFDEGFGYFGAARNFNSYTDDEIVTPGRKDSNGDGIFDNRSEVNFFYAQTAAKRDLNPSVFTSGTTNYTRDLFDAFLKGRFAVSQKSYGQRDEAVAKIRSSWDKLIAATVIHYAQEVKSDLAITNPTPVQLQDRAKHWSEMKAYFLMIDQNQDNKLGTSEFNRINLLLGTNSGTVSVGNIESAISTLKAAYSL